MIFQIKNTIKMAFTTMDNDWRDKLTLELYRIDF